jgi:glycosyltransferase involved in cell wall biosynthesis
MPLFSVIVPTYNRVAMLPVTLDSVLAQECSDYELIVVDDGSTDATVSALREHYGDGIRLLYQNNAGPGSARNAGARVACGEYLAFLDSDDVWFPWTLHIFAAAIAGNGRPAIVNGRIVEFDRRSVLQKQRRQPLKLRAYADYFAASRDGLYAGSGKCVIRKDVFEAMDGFATLRMNYEDHDLVMRLGLARGFVQIIEPVTIGYRRHAMSETMNSQKAVRGAQHLLQQELRGVYPGGRKRRWDRQRIITLHTRALSLTLARQNHVGEALRLYFRTLSWHVRLCRWRYLVGLPFVVARQSVLLSAGQWPVRNERG